VSRSAGPCDGRTLNGRAAPRWCEAEGVVFAPPKGAQALRAADGEVAVYAFVGWAHARAVGDQLGWHEAVASDELAKDDVVQAEACLLFAWLNYVSFQGIFEDGDWETIFVDSTADPVFEDLTVHDILDADSRSGGGSPACVS